MVLFKRIFLLLQVFVVAVAFSVAERSGRASPIAIYNK